MNDNKLIDKNSFRFNFLRYNILMGIISFFLVAASIYFISTKGFRLGADFKGGLEFIFTLDQSKNPSINFLSLKEKLAQKGFIVDIQTISSSEIIENTNQDEEPEESSDDTPDNSLDSQIFKTPNRYKIIFFSR